MAKVQHKKEPLNIVHQNAILCETIMKETRHQKLYKTYNVNPFKKMHVITGKPNSLHDTEEGDEDIIRRLQTDGQFKSVIARAAQEPVRKYTYPMTEAQEIGWITSPLIDADRNDRRIHFPRQNSSITRYMDQAWKSKEQADTAPPQKKA